MLVFTRWHRLISPLLLSPLLASPFILITLRVRLLFGAAKSSPYLITMLAWRPLSPVLLLVIFCLVGLRWVIWRENRSPLNQCSRCIFFSLLCSVMFQREKKIVPSWNYSQQSLSSGPGLWSLLEVNAVDLFKGEFLKELKAKCFWVTLYLGGGRDSGAHTSHNLALQLYSSYFNCEISPISLANL